MFNPPGLALGLIKYRHFRACGRLIHLFPRKLSERTAELERRLTSLFGWHGKLDKTGSTVRIEGWSTNWYPNPARWMENHSELARVRCSRAAISRIMNMPTTSTKSN